MTAKTWSDILNGFAACRTKKQAQKWLEKTVYDHASQHGISTEKSKEVILQSLGYAMGYYIDKEARRQQRLLNLTHPVLPWIGK